MTHDLETTIQLPDEEDVDVLIDFTIESWGSPGTGPSFSHPGDPPEGPEFCITKIVRCDSGEDITKVVSDDPMITDAVVERIYEIDESRGGLSYDDY